MRGLKPHKVKMSYKNRIDKKLLVTNSLLRLLHPTTFFYNSSPLDSTSGTYGDTGTRSVKGTDSESKK